MPGPNQTQPNYFDPGSNLFQTERLKKDRAFIAIKKLCSVERQKSKQSCYYDRFHVTNNK